MDKVSVIVPVYNVEGQLPRCIESIIRQTYKNIEIILVNDGSKDKSGDVCEQYAKQDSRIKVYHKSNGGVSSARNLGIEKACGEWLCFVDSDDTITPTYIDDFKFAGNHSDFYLQGYKKYKDNIVIETHDFRDCKSVNYIGIIAYAEDNYIINSPCFKLYKQSLIVNHNIKFDKKTSYGEDHLFSLDYIKVAKTASFTKTSGYNYHITNSESLTQRNVPYKEISYYAITARIKQLDILDKNPSIEYKFSIDRIMMINYIRTLKYLFKSDVKIEDFKWVQKKFKHKLCTVENKALPFSYKVLRYFSIYGIDSMLYFSLKILL